MKDISRAVVCAFLCCVGLANVSNIDEPFSYFAEFSDRMLPTGNITLGVPRIISLRDCATECFSRASGAMTSPSMTSLPCHAFEYIHSAGACILLQVSAGVHARTGYGVLKTAIGTTYYEMTKSTASLFLVVKNHALIGGSNTPHVTSNVTLDACATACFESRDVVCTSFTYSNQSAECALSDMTFNENRRLLPTGSKDYYQFKESWPCNVTLPWRYEPRIIASPGYPYIANHSWSCGFTLTAPIGQQVLLDVTSFYSDQSSCDNVTWSGVSIYDGQSETGTHIARLCDKSDCLVHPCLKSSSGSFYIRINQTTDRLQTRMVYNYEPSDSCDGHMCKNGATCQPAVTSYRCLCAEGFSGLFCERNIDDCRSNPCLFSGKCVDGVNSYTCKCLPGSTGRNCEIFVGECYKRPCTNGNCTPTISGFNCACPAGFTGKMCEYNLNECFSSPCVHGKCVDLVDGYKCECDHGYIGDLCNVNTELAECTTHSCRFGTCAVNQSGSFCQCFPGFTGFYCEINIDDCLHSPCAHGTCVDYVDAYLCNCSKGYVGKRCDIFTSDPCNGSPCIHGYCSVTNDGFTCICHDGFTGRTCDRKLRPCDYQPCQNGRCFNIETDTFTPTNPSKHWHLYKCQCFDGFVGVNCSNPVTSCKHDTCINGICAVNKTSKGDVMFCKCYDGYSGAECTTRTISRQCLHVNCNYGQCVSTSDGHLCICHASFTGRYCESKVDPCSSVNCSGNIICVVKGNKCEVLFSPSSHKTTLLTMSTNVPTHPLSTTSMVPRSTHWYLIPTRKGNNTTNSITSSKFNPKTTYPDKLGENFKTIASTTTTSIPAVSATNIKDSAHPLTKVSTKANTWTTSLTTVSGYNIIYTTHPSYVDIASTRSGTTHTDKLGENVTAVAKTRTTQQTTVGGTITNKTTARPSPVTVASAHSQITSLQTVGGSINRKPSRLSPVTVASASSQTTFLPTVGGSNIKENTHSPPVAVSSTRSQKNQWQPPTKKSTTTLSSKNYTEMPQVVHSSSGTLNHRIFTESVFLQFSTSPNNRQPSTELIRMNGYRKDSHLNQRQTTASSTITPSAGPIQTSTILIKVKATSGLTSSPTPIPTTEFTQTSTILTMLNATSIMVSSTSKPTAKLKQTSSILTKLDSTSGLIHDNGSWVRNYWKKTYIIPNPTQKGGGIKVPRITIRPATVDNAFYHTAKLIQMPTTSAGVDNTSKTTGASNGVWSKHLTSPNKMPLPAAKILAPARTVPSPGVSITSTYKSTKLPTSPISNSVRFHTASSVSTHGSYQYTKPFETTKNLVQNRTLSLKHSSNGGPIRSHSPMETTQSNLDHGKGSTENVTKCDGSSCTFPNVCNNKNCVFGYCANIHGNALCICQVGYSGEDCSIQSPNVCDNKSCVFGYCANIHGNALCICQVGYSGEDCSIKIEEDSPSDDDDVITVQSAIIGALGAALIVVTSGAVFICYHRKRRGSIYISSPRLPRTDEVSVKKRYSSRDIHSELRSGYVNPVFTPVENMTKRNQNTHPPSSNTSCASDNSRSTASSNSRGQWYDDVQPPVTEAVTADQSVKTLIDSWRTRNSNIGEGVSTSTNRVGNYYSVPRPSVPKRDCNQPPMPSFGGSGLRRATKTEDIPKCVRSSGGQSILTSGKTLPVGENPFFRTEDGNIGLRLDKDCQRSPGDFQTLLDEILDSTEGEIFNKPDKRMSILHISGADNGKSQA